MRTLIVVEDEEDLRWSLERLLTRALAGWKVLAAASVPEALAHAASGIDCLVTDVKLGDASGVDLVMHFRKTLPGLPCVVMTAYPTESDRVSVNKLTRTRYLEKPFEHDLLVAAINELQHQRESFTGEMAVDGLPDILQLVALSPALSRWPIASFLVRQQPRG